MKQCPIIRMDIDDEECAMVTIEAYSDLKDKKAAVPNKYKRIIGWKSICKQCRYHKGQA